MAFARRPERRNAQSRAERRAAALRAVLDDRYVADAELAAWVERQTAGLPEPLCLAVRVHILAWRQRHGLA